MSIGEARALDVPVVRPGPRAKGARVFGLPRWLNRVLRLAREDGFSRGGGGGPVEMADEARGGGNGVLEESRLSA